MLLTEKEETSNLHTHMHTQTHAHAHTPQIEQTGNSHSVISCILHVFTQTTSSVTSLVFNKFVLLCFVSLCVICCFWICLFRFSLSLLFTLVFSYVMTGLVMLTETLPFFFQTRHKKG